MVQPGPSKMDAETYTNYHFFLYFVMTTISTIGYFNDFTPASSKIVLTALIIVAILVNSTKISKLIHLLSSKSMYARMRYKISDDTPHIILTGSVSNIAAADFFLEFFHEDHGDQPRHIVILLPFRPDSHMENLLRMPQFQSRVFYIQGDPIKENDLRRCHTEKAKAIIIMCNKHTSDSQEEDARTILHAMIIKKYLKLHRAQSVRLCMQILRPEGKTHYYLSLNRQVKSDQVICVEELKLSLLAKSCLCPGLITFISNLITSSGEPPKKSDLDSEWLQEYWKGKQFEIYKTTLPIKFSGKSFSWVAANIYKNFSAILFAIEIEVGQEIKILPNPGDFILPEHRKIVGYIITEDKIVADEISNFQVDPSEIHVRKRLASTTQIYQANLAMPSMTGLLDNEDESDGDEYENDTIQTPSKMKYNYMNNFMAGEVTGIEEKCHISPSKIILSDVTYFTMEENILAINHIILAGIVPNLINFVMPLRAKYLPKYPPIVILNPEEPSYKYWNQISFFPEIYFVKGSALNVRDLIRANIKKASMVVILASSSFKAKQTVEAIRAKAFDTDKIGDEVETDNNDEDLLDAKTIFKYKEVKKIMKNIPILTELVSPQNVAYLLPDPYDYSLMRKFGYTQTPTFASGEIFISSVIDSLICQSYFNPALITVLNQLIVGNVESYVKSGKPQNTLPLALYRLPKCKDNTFPYVLTNPEPNTILTELDIIFALCQDHPPDSSYHWGAPLENLEEHKSLDSNFSKKENFLKDFEELEKDKNKSLDLNEHSKDIFNKIKEVMANLKELQEEAEGLSGMLSERQKRTMNSIKLSLTQELRNLIPENLGNRIAYDEEDMLTASSPSSYEDDEEEVEDESGNTSARHNNASAETHTRVNSRSSYVS